MLSVSVHEVAALSKRELPDRYNYFLKRIADQEELYILKDAENNFYFDLINEKKFFHMWSAMEFAEAFIKNNGLVKNSVVVDFDILVKVIYPLILDEAIILSIMPVAEQIGYEISIADFSRQLHDYIEEWYD